MDGKQGISFLHGFGMCQKCLTLIGLWPDSKSSKYNEITSLSRFALIILLIVGFVNLAQTSKLIMIWGDLDTMSDIISTANLPIGVTVFKMMVFWNYRKGSLISLARHDWDSCRTTREIQNMQSSVVIARRMSMICIILGFGTVNGHLAIRIGQEFRILPGKPDTRLPFIDSYFPYDYKSTPAYEISWLLQYTASALATVAYSGIYSLFVNLMLHLCGQLANLRDRIENCIFSLDTRKSSFRQRLSQLVEKHESLNEYAQVIETIFNAMFLTEILACTIQFCMQGFLLVTLSSKKNMDLPILQILFMTVYVMHIGTHLFICCFVAEKVSDESFSIHRAVYNCEWYNLTPKDARMLLIIMNQAQKPLKVTAGKFCVFSMSLYAQIFKTSGGYLSMLLAVRDRI